MIKDNISNINSYNLLNERIRAGLNYLSEANFSQISDGKHNIDGENLFVNIQTYTTKSDADFEVHRKYIDIQYIISGSEYIAVTDLNTCSTVIEYDENRDIEFLKGGGEFIKLSQGEFMILYPQDAHKPSISLNINSPAQVRKAVIKVAIN
ncbi:MAG: YhcH/YjgK/YiaL family protein [Candidatus Gastranaerophilales bacterium]|nr:YhcH/YjgK/YiaL family protein [Candidatus Gastranaerophilales bacterium]